MNNKITVIALVVAVLAVTVFLVFKSAPVANLGSVTAGNECTATTTSGIFVMPRIAHFSPTTTARGGALCNVIVTTAGTAGGNINFYDATTTSVLLRASRYATSSILIASFPTNLAAGTYVIDAPYGIGLIAVTDGTVGTTTWTYR